MKDPTASSLRVGLTGGIASGKSAVADDFAELGAPVIDTDILARTVVEPGTEGLRLITERFGSDILDASGMLDRATMRDRVFADPRMKHDLESILHPLIREATQTEIIRTAGLFPYQIVVVPLLIETGFKSLVDRVLVVDCPEDIQRERLLARDGSSAATADAMIAAQASREQRLAAADDVVVNDSTRAELQRRVAALHEQYLRLAAA